MVLILQMENMDETCVGGVNNRFVNVPLSNAKAVWKGRGELHSAKPWRVVGEKLFFFYFEKPN